MPPAGPASERVGSSLLWGIGFSVVFHVVLFSPQLAAWLDPEQRHEVIGELKRAAEKKKDPGKPADAPKRPEDKPEDKPDPSKPPERKAPEQQAQKTPEEQRKEEERQAAQKPPEGDPAANLPPIPTPEPSPAYPDVEDVAIGQDEGDPMSVVIIGREDFEEHMAQLSVVSQAGFRMSDAGGDGTVAYGRGTSGDGGGGGGSAPNATATTVTANSPGTPSTPESTRIASAAPVERPDGASQPDVPAKPAEPVVTPVVRAEPKPPEPTPPTPPQPPAEQNVPGEPILPEVPPPPPVVEQPKQPDAKAPPVAPAEPAVPVEPKPTLPPPANQPPASQPGGGIASTERAKDGPKTDAPGEAGKAGGSGPSPTPGTGGKGQLSDLESPATSVISVDPKLWKNGRLVAAQGIQLKPRQPQFTTLQLVSNLPNCRPPLVSLTFDKTGKCVDVFFNQSSGDQEIDGVIRNSCFFWRAAGRKIEQLKGDEKVRVTLHLLL